MEKPSTSIPASRSSHVSARPPTLRSLQAGYAYSFLFGTGKQIFPLVCSQHNHYQLQKSYLTSLSKQDVLPNIQLLIQVAQPYPVEEEKSERIFSHIHTGSHSCNAVARPLGLSTSTADW